MANHKSIGHIISIIHRYSEGYLMEALKDLDLHGSGQIRIVLTLAKQKEGISQEELAKILIVDKTTISRMVRPLIKNGIVARKPNPKDKRAYLLQLSNKARVNIPEIKRRAYKWTKILGRDLAQEDLDKLFNYLEILKRNAHEYIQGKTVEKK